ncbi:MAG: nucleotidyl transferase AbiEii/AbiGii toxin family protein [Candidatus Jacksonbacteria bacterium]|nr:nucleotidyl transferase AbiEii/AbiGii toxin family protein [Candidatus Jacksonbacteria bacterium]
MLNKEKHQRIIGAILKDIYTNISISSLLGFKGGTCAYLFYDLPRFSVDLDFDLLAFDAPASERILEEISHITSVYGKVMEQRVKRYTIFLLLSYGKEDRNIKIEINTRRQAPNIRDQYELKEYLGIPILVAKKEYCFTTKLVALTMRRVIAVRDVYDIYYFGKKLWDIDGEILNALTGKNVKEYLSDCIAVVQNIPDSGILHGLGELLSNKEKAWVKQHLKAEVVFLLKTYQAASV